MLQNTHFFGIIFFASKTAVAEFLFKNLMYGQHHLCRCSFDRKWFILSLLYLTVMFADCIKGDVLKVHNISRGKNLNTFVK